MNKKSLHMIAFILLIIGGLNWLLIALFNWEIAIITDAVSPLLTKIIYILVGLAAIFELLFHKEQCTVCKGKMQPTDGTAGTEPLQQS